jgi:hypothetical protein
MISDEFHCCGGHLRERGRDRNAQSFAAADCSYGVKHLAQRDGFTAENITMPVLPALHCQNQTSRDIAYIN